MNHWGSYASRQQQAPPLPAPRLIGLSSQYANHHYPVILQLKETVTAVNGDMAVIDISTGYPLVRCRGKIVSARGRKEFCDPYGNPLFIVKRKIKVSANTTYEGYTPDERLLLFTVKTTFSLPGAAKMTATFRNIDGQEVVLALNGSFLERNASINFGSSEGPPVAHITRNYKTGMELIFGGQTYYLAVEPGVDAPLMAAICLCLDEKQTENDWTTTAMILAI
ncbi:duf567 domain protein [Moniliophthora roreri]|uniref:Duf567 domain protein n=1 Tax=Moniliophthora roreri TaxID=221103 RepID=A0A0W0EXN3_MONRR|nr:duf567 domain protein [Moniliophthora roreri]